MDGLIDEFRSMIERHDRNSLIEVVMTNPDSQSGPVRPETLLNDVEGSSLNDQLVKAYLDEVLLMLIVVRDGACGQDLIQDLYQLGCSLSPGTIYPHLHDLASEGFLDKHERRRTKQFEVADPDEVDARIQAAFDDMGRLSALFMLYASETNVDGVDTNT